MLHISGTTNTMIRGLSGLVTATHTENLICLKFTKSSGLKLKQSSSCKSTFNTTLKYSSPASQGFFLPVVSVLPIVLSL